MGIRKILTDKDPALHKVCRPVENFDRKLHTLLDDMKETLEEANGVGLAAPQVGILRRVVIVDTGEEVLELVNPELFVTRKDDRFLGQRVELRSSRDLTKEEMTESINRLKVWAAEQGIFLPDADEKAFIARIEAEMKRNAKYL